MRAYRQLLVLATLLFMALSVQAKDFKEGVQYELVKPPVPVSTPANKIEVVEMFWYGCPHCFHFEPELHKWLKHKPANVEFIRIPATFYPLWKLHARAFYTEQVLGIVDKMHKVIFDTYHLERNRLDSEKKIRALFVKHGVKGSDFDDTFHSFAVETRLARAVDLTTRYGINGVPALIVNGKYRVTEKPGGPTRLEILDYLIKKESK